LRLGYLRWLFHLLLGEAPSHAEIGKAVGVTGQAVSGWMKRETAPTDYDSVKALVAYFGADERWLVKGEGEPSRPDLWSVWLRARSRKVSDLSTLNDLGEVERPAQQRKSK
jgi:transcriptional regulator with XRE-family HTH domain